MKSDRTITKRIKLSNKLAVEMTIGISGQFVCEWEPEFPKRLTKAELDAYRKGRNTLITELARETGTKIMLVET